jgi:hypothetical protein
MNAYLLRDVLILNVYVMIITLVLKTLVTLIPGANSITLFVMIMMPVQMIPAALLLVAHMNLEILMIKIHVP